MTTGCSSFEAYGENHSRWYGCSMLFSACCLPFGKADDTASPALSRVRRRLTTASPLTPWIYGILDFCNVRVNIHSLLIPNNASLQVESAPTQYIYIPVQVINIHWLSSQILVWSLSKRYFRRTLERLPASQKPKPSNRRHKPHTWEPTYVTPKKLPPSNAARNVRTAYISYNPQKGGKRKWNSWKKICWL